MADLAKAHTVFNKFSTAIFAGAGFKDMYEEILGYVDNTTKEQRELTYAVLQMHFNKIATKDQMLTPGHDKFQEELKYLNMIIELRRYFLHMSWSGPSDAKQWYNQFVLRHYQPAWDNCRAILKKQWKDAGLCIVQLDHLYSTLYRVDYDHATREQDNMHFTGSYDQEGTVITKDLQWAALDMNIVHFWKILLQGMNHVKDDQGNVIYACLPESTSQDVMLCDVVMPFQQV